MQREKTAAETESSTNTTNWALIKFFPLLFASFAFFASA
jgi:hypothetical protein